MKKLSNKEISDIYVVIANYHEKFLKKHGVKLPNLKLTNGLYSKDVLALVYLAQGYPNTKIVTKAELTQFIQLYYPDVNDVQQARHLAAQKGWFILSGTRNDNSSQKLNPGEYKLESLEKFYPGFTAERREEVFTGDYWENLKRLYGYKCACCGSEEGKKHRYMKNVITKLQKGHMNPNKPLEEGNIIPQCETCNRADRNYWIYDEKGRVVQIANAKVIDNCSEKIKKEIYERLFFEYNGKNPKDL
ncbi:MAG: hypothetical protein J5687_08775 [Treponema sp.]|nr:hypothetical protein [Treponema sp.]